MIFFWEFVHCLLEPMMMMMTPIKGQDIERYISKCAVCETPTKETGFSMVFLPYNFSITCVIAKYFHYNHPDSLDKGWQNIKFVPEKVDDDILTNLSKNFFQRRGTK
jgi:hypothetical protein